MDRGVNEVVLESGTQRGQDDARRFTGKLSLQKCNANSFYCPNMEVMVCPTARVSCVRRTSPFLTNSAVTSVFLSTVPDHVSARRVRPGPRDNDHHPNHSRQHPPARRRPLYRPAAAFDSCHAYRGFGARRWGGTACSTNNRTDNPTARGP